MLHFFEKNVEQKKKILYNMIVKFKNRKFEK